MPAHDLVSRISKLEKALSAFSQELRLALRYIQPDAASSLTKSRVVLEKLLVQVYTVEMGQEPRKPLLGDMLVDNQFTRRIERRILSRMNAIRDMGNLGPHGEAVEPNDAARVLDDLCEVLEWYLRRYSGNDPGVRAILNTECADYSVGSDAGSASGHSSTASKVTEAMIRAADSNDITFREVEIRLSATWEQFRTWLAGQLPGGSIHRIQQDPNQENSFSHSGKPGCLSWPIIVSGNKEGIPFIQRYDLIHDWLHPLAIRLAPPNAGIPWDSSLFPVKDNNEHEVSITSPDAELTDCTYWVLFASL
jgi:hypothetical protein